MKILIIKESLLQSILADIFTLGLLMLCIWISKFSVTWTIICVIFFGFMLICTIKYKRKNVFYNNQDLLDYILNTVNTYNCCKCEKLKAYTGEEKSISDNEIVCPKCYQE